MVAKNLAYGPVSTRAAASGWLVRAAVAAAVGGAMFAPGVYAAEEAAAEGTELEEVTVTGSRIVRRDLTAASPIVTVNTETFEKSSTTAIESVLQQMPQFVPGGNQFVSGAQAGAAQTPGIATLNLRGLGPNRNLVLIDGRRPQPANAALVVDVNTIPQGAIQGVEVITGGASAVYGPDALAGVTNFILKKDFQGLEVNTHHGITQEGDAAETRVSALMGMNSGDGRGNIMLSVDWNKRNGMFLRDRNFFVNGWRDPFNPGGDFIQSPGTAAGAFAGLPRNDPSQAAVCAVLGRPVGCTTPANNTVDIRFNNDGTAFTQPGAFGYNGPLGTLDTGRTTMTNILANGNLDQKYTTQYGSTPLERHSLFLRGRYDITENTTALVQANYSNNVVKTRGNFAPAVTVWSVQVPRDGRTLPAELNQLLNSRPNNTYCFTGTAGCGAAGSNTTPSTNAALTGTLNPAFGPNAPWPLFQVLNYFGTLNAENTSNVWQVMAGLEGKMAIKDWTWEAYFSRGDTSTLSETPTPSLQRYQALIAAPNFGRNAKITAPPAGVLAGRGYQLECTSGLPVFNEFTPSADCINSMQTRTRQITTLSQDIFEANMQGGAFELPAGEVRFAAGAAYRKNNFRFDPGYPVEQINDNPIGLFASNKTLGSTNVKEAYVEFLVPVVDKLELELGFRLSDFNTAGTKSTYKGLFTWKAMDQITFRGGYNFATRAPNTAELFTGPTLLVVPFPQGDFCSVTTQSPLGNVAANPNRAKVQALCEAIIGNTGTAFSANPNTFSRPGGPAFFPLEIEVTAGNPNVGPEQAQTYTLGTVITDPFGLDNLSITLDAYRINVKDAIAPISSTTVYNRCFDPALNPTFSVTNEACQLIRRNPTTGDREETRAAYSNLGTIKTQGVDLAVTWNRDVGPGNLGVNTTVSWLDYYKYQPVAGAVTNDATGTLDQGGQYDFRLLTNLNYKLDAFNVGLQWRFLPGVKSAAAGIVPATTQLGTGAYSVFGLTAGYEVGNLTFRAGVDNVLNRQPSSLNRILGPVGSTTQLATGDSNTDQTNASFYDILGRRFFVGVKAKL
jgi:iron complex outermembrane recepter protein